MSETNKQRIWLTYSWADNKNGDVDAIAHTLEQSGLVVEMDKNSLLAGERLWEKIAQKIQDPTISGLVIYMTQNSLQSKGCGEEINYALHRDLKSKNDSFPIIGLLPSPIEENLIPLMIKTRKYIRMKDPDWKEQIISAIQRKDLVREIPNLIQYYFKATFFRDELGDQFIFEMRPISGVWSPFVVSIEMAERERVKPFLIFGPANTPNNMPSSLFGLNEGQMNNGEFWGITARNEASSTQSYYLTCTEIPSRIIFGQLNGSLYEIKIDPSVMLTDLKLQLKKKGLHQIEY